MILAGVLACGGGETESASEGSSSSTAATATATATASASATGASTSTGESTSTGLSTASESSGSTGTSTTTGETTSDTSDTSDTSTSTTGGEVDPGPLRVDPDHPAWLHRPGKGPTFICGPGDPEDFLFRGALQGDGTRDGDQAALIAKIAPTGANAIYFQAIRSHGGDGDATHNPFINNDPAQGLNPAVLDQWEVWLTALSDAGVVPFFFIYDDSADPWKTGNQVSAAEAEFVGQLVDRFADLPLLVWVVAEEYGEALTQARASGIAALIREHDPVHAIAVHQNHGLGFEFAGDPNVDQFAIQYNVGSAAELRAGVSQAFTAAAGAYNLNLSEAGDWGSGATHRDKSWASATAGAYVMVLGMDIAATPVGDLEACGHLVDLFEATPEFVNMAPHDDLALTPGSYVFADPGAAYLVYAPAAESLGVAGLTPGSYALRWLDPATGAIVEATADVAGTEASWARPPEIGSEVALAVVRQ